MLQKWLFVVPLLFVATPLYAEKPLAPESIPGATIVTAEQLVDLIISNPELIIVDARKNTEYAKGHIEGAVFLLDTEMTPEKLDAVAPEFTTPIAFYCNGPRCLRSSNSVRRALGWGYGNIYWFRGGWKEWINKELPIVQ